jgi:hypothetical protein
LKHIFKTKAEARKKTKDPQCPINVNYKAAHSCKQEPKVENVLVSSYRAVNKTQVPKVGAEHGFPQENLFPAEAEGEFEEALVNNEKEKQDGANNGEEGIQDIHGDKEVEGTNEEELVNDEQEKHNGTHNGEEGIGDINGDEEIEGAIEEPVNVESEKQDGKNNDDEGTEGIQAEQQGLSPNLGKESTESPVSLSEQEFVEIPDNLNN